MISPGGLKGTQEKLFIKNYSKVVPLKRMGNLDDLIGPVIFLSSEMSKYITGQNLFVDGGFSIKWVEFLMFDIKITSNRIVKDL